MKKIFTLTLLLVFQLVVLAQSDVTSSVFTNPGFEDGSGFDTDWTLVNNNPAVMTATFTDAGTVDAASGDHAAHINVTTGDHIWELYLERTLNTTGFSDKELIFNFKTKRQWGTNPAWKFQVFIGESGGTNLVPAGSNDGNREQWYNGEAENTYEDKAITITVPNGVTELVLQLWVGGKLGSYFFDDFMVTGEVINPNLLTGTIDINGSAVLGETLTTAVNNVNSTALNYQWKRNDVDISGATENSYIIVADDVGSTLLVVVTADDKEGSISDETGTVLENPAQTAAVFEKLKKGVNQDVSMAFAGVYPKVIHERAHMQAISEAGFESVRIFLPYSAGGFTEFEPRIQDALDYNLAVVVCMWGNGSWANNINTGTTQIANRWGAIADAWKNQFSNDVVFELLNEPSGIGFDLTNDTDTANTMKLYNAAIIAIRDADPDRPILVGAPGWNDSDLMDPWVSEDHLTYTLSDGNGFFGDPNIGVAIHYYAPRHEDGNNFAMWTASLNGNWQSSIDNHINKAVDWQETYNTDMPVVVTEWGAWMFESRTNGTDLPQWLDYQMQRFEDHGFGSMWYTGIQNNQRQFAIFDSELGWNQVVLDALTGVTPVSPIPATSQIMDAEFVSGPSETWELTSNTGVTKSFVSGSSALSGSNSVKLTVTSPTDCQMFQQSLGVVNSEPVAPGRTLLHLIQGETYKISFMAESIGSDGQVKILLKDTNNLNTTYYDSGNITITTSTQTHTLSYTHTTATAMDVRFEFDIGSIQQTLVLDKVIFKRDNGNLSVDEFLISKVKMYPNPTNGILNFKTITEIQHIAVIDITGKIISAVKNQNSINIEALAPGVYFVRIGLTNNETVVKKVIKK